jgi:hypothetical protein
MGFASGSISFRRFAVIGDSPNAIEQEMLDALSEHALRVGEIGTPEEIEYGWSGGRHILDANFSFDHNVFGDALVFGLRIDTNKVPGELKKAYQLMEEEAAAAQNPSGFASKNQKREAKEIAQRKIEDDLRSGQFRRSKLVPILWDLPSQTVYCSASNTTEEYLLEIFERTFDLKLMPLSSGTLSLRTLEPKGRRRDYEDLRPTRFVIGPEGEGQVAEYPWVAKGPEPKDFLGNEFLVWLWHEADRNGGVVSMTNGRDVTLMFDRALDLDCVFGQTGKDSLRGEGPTRMPEALDALRSGKIPRKAGLILDASRQQFSFNFNAETFAIGSLKLPEVEEAETPRVLFEERITLLRDFCETIDSLFESFLKHRSGSSWDGQTTQLRRWIQQSGRAPLSAVAVA